MNYTNEEMLKFFQSGHVPNQSLTFDELWFKVDNVFIPRLESHLKEIGANVHVQSELVQVQPSPTINIAFWDLASGHWVQEFAVSLGYEGKPFFMPVARQS